MKVLFKNIVARTYKPLLEKYLSRTRTYTYQNITLEIPPEVFHPGFFFSTKFLLRHLSDYSMQGLRFLELGAGSGLIAICAARKGARVTASDINKIAVTHLMKNALRNGVDISVIYSDLFADIPVHGYDFIAINPPYYKKNPVEAKEYAWFCGANGEYFEALFSGLGRYMHAGTKTFMVIFDGCDLPMILQHATNYGLIMEQVNKKKNLLETSFIYQIRALL